MVLNLGILIKSFGILYRPKHEANRPIFNYVRIMKHADEAIKIFKII